MKKIMIAALVVSAVVLVESSAAPAADDAIKQVFAQLDQCLANSDAKCVGGQNHQGQKAGRQEP
jgi:hypothetical protein